MDVVQTVATTALAALVVPLLFLVPGYLLQTAYLRGARREMTDQVMLARSAASALLIHAIVLPWTVWLGEDAAEGLIRPYATAAWALVVLLALPVLLGALLQLVANASRPKWLAAAVRFAGLSHHMRLDDAWAFVFARERAAWVRVHKTDGEVIVGYFGPASFAAPDTVRGDLFLERQHIPAPGKVLGPAVPFSAGVWIKGDQIAYIEFYRGTPRVRKESV